MSKLEHTSFLEKFMQLTLYKGTPPAIKIAFAPEDSIKSNLHVVETNNTHLFLLSDILNILTASSLLQSQLTDAVFGHVYVYLKHKDANHAIFDDNTLQIKLINENSVRYLCTRAKQIKSNNINQIERFEYLIFNEALPSVDEILTQSMA